jgi:hypothetical protein
MSSIVPSFDRSALARGGTLGAVMAAISLLAAGRAEAACQTAATSYAHIRQNKKCTNSSVPLTAAVVSSNGFPSIPPYGGPEGANTEFSTSDPYVVYYNTAYSNGKLLVFFPGNNADAEDYTELMLRAADHGYRVIGMQYWQQNHNDQCGEYDSTTVPTLDMCIRDFRWDQYSNSGVATELVNGSAADSVRYRLRKLLQYLDDRYDDQTQGGVTWGHFLAGNPPGESSPYINWGSVAVGGHSNGSRLAAFIASRVNVYRVFLFSGTHEDVQDPAPPDVRVSPSWLWEENMATPTNRIYIFEHTDDAKYGMAFLNWLTMGMGGSHEWNIAWTPIPSYARMLYSDVTDGFEGCEVRDDEGVLGEVGGHKVTAINCEVGDWPARVPAWDFMFSH